MPTPSHLGYDARQITGQTTQKTFQRGLIMMYDAVKWVVNFIGQMIKIFLAK